MLDIASEFGINKTQVLKAMHIGMSFKELSENGFPLPDLLNTAELAITSLLKVKDLDNYTRGKTKSAYELQSKFQDKMKRMKLDQSFGEIDDYLTACARLRRKLPVNELNACWHKILHNIEQEIL